MSPRFPNSQTMLWVFLVYKRKMNEWIMHSTEAEHQVLKKTPPKLGFFTGQPGCWVGRFSTEDAAACSQSSLWHLRRKESHGKGEKKGATCSGAKCSFLSLFRGRGGSRLKLPKDTTSLQNHKNSRPCPRDNHMFNQRRNQQVNAEKTAPSQRKATGKQEAPWPAKCLQSSLQAALRATGPHRPVPPPPPSWQGAQPFKSLLFTLPISSASCLDPGIRSSAVNPWRFHAFRAYIFSSSQAKSSICVAWKTGIHVLVTCSIVRAAVTVI